MSAFDTFFRARDSALGNALAVRQEQRQNALDTSNRQYRDQTLDLRRSEFQAEQAEALRERQKTAFGAVAMGLRRMPAERRWEAFQGRGLSGLRAEGVTDDMLAMITPETMGDADLDMVIGMAGLEVPQPRILQGQRGALDAIDPYTGAVTAIRPGEREAAPNGYRWTPDGALEPIKGGPADPVVIDRQSDARRAPPRPRASGRSRAGATGRSASVGGGLPAGFVVD